jgi:hypothetical protein
MCICVYVRMYVLKNPFSYNSKKKLVIFSSLCAKSKFLISNDVATYVIASDFTNMGILAQW